MLRRTQRQPAILAFQVANAIGVLYGVVLVYGSSSAFLLVGLVFPAVAMSRQLVYSTVFHQIGEVIGFENYGVILGLANLCVSLFSMLQTPLEQWSENLQMYKYTNAVLCAITLPLFGSVLWTLPPRPQATKRPKTLNGRTRLVDRHLSAGDMRRQIADVLFLLRSDPTALSRYWTAGV